MDSTASAMFFCDLGALPARASTCKHSPSGSNRFPALYLSQTVLCRLCGLLAVTVATPSRGESVLAAVINSVTVRSGAPLERQCAAVQGLHPIQFVPEQPPSDRATRKAHAARLLRGCARSDAASARGPLLLPASSCQKRLAGHVSKRLGVRADSSWADGRQCSSR